MRFFRYLLPVLTIAWCLVSEPLCAQQTSPPEGDSTSTDNSQLEEVNEQEDTQETAPAVEDSARADEAALNEDPEAQRRAVLQEQPELRNNWPKIDFYGSLRVHGINHFNELEDAHEIELGDGGSRIGVFGNWQLSRKWSVFARGEAGFDILGDYTDKGNVNDTDGGIEPRLYYGGFDSDRLSASFGKNWSAYYKIAGMADRFSIFGGSATGVYNAGTDGGETGTGRADDVAQIRLYTSSLKAIKIKPFNLNIQYQEGQSIPRVKHRKYGQTWGVSAWLETQTDFGIGLAYHRADIINPDDPLIEEAGINGDATAFAMSFRTYGERWYAALVLARLDNIETTDTFKYIQGYGAELYTQWEFKDRWWLVAGANWLDPDNDDPDAGKYQVTYGVIGLRYTFDSFKRMLYAEYRIDRGTLTSGIERENEITFGVRWDFGY